MKDSALSPATAGAAARAGTNHRKSPRVRCRSVTSAAYVPSQHKNQSVDRGALGRVSAGKPSSESGKNKVQDLKNRSSHFAVVAVRTLPRAPVVAGAPPFHSRATPAHPKDPPAPSPPPHDNTQSASIIASPTEPARPSAGRRSAVAPPDGSAIPEPRSTSAPMPGDTQPSPAGAWSTRRQPGSRAEPRRSHPGRGTPHSATPHLTAPHTPGGCAVPAPRGTGAPMPGDAHAAPAGTSNTRRQRGSRTAQHRRTPTPVLRPAQPSNGAWSTRGAQSGHPRSAFQHSGKPRTAPRPCLDQRDRVARVPREVVAGQLPRRGHVVHATTASSSAPLPAPRGIDSGTGAPHGALNAPSGARSGTRVGRRKCGGSRVLFPEPRGTGSDAGRQAERQRSLGARRGLPAGATLPDHAGSGKMNWILLWI